VSGLDAVLPLPDSVQVHLLCPDVLCLRGVIPSWREELVGIAEKIGGWKQSSQINPGSGDSYNGAYRTSRSMVISHQHPDFGPCFTRFETALVKAFHTGAHAYKAYNPKLEITDDSGYELLRYHEGECFGLHVDSVVGRHEGFRQLSAVLYLNDDYTGGETYFPRQEIKFKAQAGDLLLFPSNFCYPHESLPVIKGTKYAVVTWFVAYPQKPAEQEEEKHGEQGEGDADGTSAPADGGVRLHGSAGSGSDEGEPQTSDREHTASVG
jgi:hypothetical protein